MTRTAAAPPRPLAALVALTAVLTATLTVPVVAVTARPARALGVPTMGVIVSGTNTPTWQVCGYGDADAVVGQWLLTIEGTRSTGEPISYVVPWTDTTFFECVRFDKDAPAGAWVATVSYVGAGLDVAGTFAGYGAWSPGRPDEKGDSGIT